MSSLPTHPRFASFPKLDAMGLDTPWSAPFHGAVWDFAANPDPPRGRLPLLQKFCPKHEVWRYRRTGYHGARASYWHTLLAPPEPEYYESEWSITHDMIPDSIYDLMDIDYFGDDFIIHFPQADDDEFDDDFDDDNDTDDDQDSGYGSYEDNSDDEWDGVMPPLQFVPEDNWDVDMEELNAQAHALNGNRPHKKIERRQKQQQKQWMNDRNHARDSKQYTNSAWLLTRDLNQEQHTINGNPGKGKERAHDNPKRKYAFKRKLETAKDMEKRFARLSGATPEQLQELDADFKMRMAQAEREPIDDAAFEDVNNRHNYLRRALDKLEKRNRQEQENEEDEEEEILPNPPIQRAPPRAQPDAPAEPQQVAVVQPPPQFQGRRLPEGLDEALILDAHCLFVYARIRVLQEPTFVFLPLHQPSNYIVELHNGEWLPPANEQRDPNSDVIHYFSLPEGLTSVLNRLNGRMVTVRSLDYGLLIHYLSVVPHRRNFHCHIRIIDHMDNCYFKEFTAIFHGYVEGQFGVPINQFFHPPPELTPGQLPVLTPPPLPDFLQGRRGALVARGLLARGLPPPIDLFAGVRRQNSDFKAAYRLICPKKKLIRLHEAGGNPTSYHRNNFYCCPCGCNQQPKLCTRPTLLALTLRTVANRNNRSICVFKDKPVYNFTPGIDEPFPHPSDWPYSWYSTTKPALTPAQEALLKTAVFEEGAPADWDKTKQLLGRYNSSSSWNLGNHIVSSAVHFLHGLYRLYSSRQPEPHEIYKYQQPNFPDKFQIDHPDNDNPPQEGPDKQPTFHPDVRPHIFRAAEVVVDGEDQTISVKRIQPISTFEFYRQKRKHHNLFRSIIEISKAKSAEGIIFEEDLSHMTVEKHTLNEGKTTRVTPDSTLIHPREHHSRLERHANTISHINTDHRDGKIQNTVLLTQLEGAHRFNNTLVKGGFRRAPLHAES